MYTVRLNRVDSTDLYIITPYKVIITIPVYRPGYTLFIREKY